MLHCHAGDPDVAVQVVEVQLRRVADLAPVVLVGVAAEDDHVAGHQGGRVEGHLGRPERGAASGPGVGHLAPGPVVQVKQEDLVAQLTRTEVHIMLMKLRRQCSIAILAVNLCKAIYDSNYV